MNAVEAAAFLGIHVETLRKFARRNEVPCFKIGRDWRFRKESLLRWADEQRVVAKPADSRPLLMVIDDEVQICRVVVSLVERLGYRGCSATSGAEGLALVAEETPALILLDLMMPVMNGAQFLVELRKSHDELPVVIITGYAESKLLQQAMQHPPVMLLPKPVERAMLERTINTLVGTKR